MYMYSASRDRMMFLFIKHLRGEVRNHETESTIIIILCNIPAHNYLTDCGLVMSHGDLNLGQNWRRKWLVAWRTQQTITWNNVDLLLVRFSSIHLN